MAEVLIVIAEKNFQDMEYSETRKAIENAGITVKVASKTTGIKKGAFGSDVRAELPLQKVNVKDFDAVIFIGGPGAQPYIDDKEATRLAAEFSIEKKIVGAICIAPLILASSGILAGKKVTVWDDGKSTQLSLLKDAEAVYTGKDVEEDGNIITANGPHSAKAFGDAIARRLAQK